MRYAIGLTAAAICGAIGLWFAVPASGADAEADCKQDKDWELRIRGCSSVISRDPSAPWAFLSRGRAYMVHQHDYGRAIADFTELIRLLPDDAQGYAYRGRALLLKESPDRGLADLREAFGRQPDHKIYWVFGDPAPAIAELSKIIERHPTQAIAHVFRAGAYGWKFYRGDRRSFERAVADYSEAIRLDGRMYGAFLHRGDLHAAIGDYDRAIADFSEAIKLEPKHFKAHERRGHQYHSKGDYDRAIVDFSEAISLLSASGAKAVPAGLYSSRAATYLLKGDHDRAIADYSRAIEIVPKSPLYYSDRALAYTRKGDHDRAIADYNSAIERAPRDYYYDSRAQAYLKAGKATEALSDVEHALSIWAENASALSTRGQILEALGRKEEAIADFRRALEILPSLKRSQEGLKRLGAAP